MQVTIEETKLLLGVSWIHLDVWDFLPIVFPPFQLCPDPLVVTESIF